MRSQARHHCHHVFHVDLASTQLLIAVSAFEIVQLELTVMSWAASIVQWEHIPSLLVPHQVVLAHCALLVHIPIMLVPLLVYYAMLENSRLQRAILLRQTAQNALLALMQQFQAQQSAGCVLKASSSP